MGNIRRLKRKYNTPFHPWEKDRLVAEKEYSREYGFKSKREIWKTVSKLNKFKALAKEYITQNTPQSEKEANQLLLKLRAIGLLNETSILADVLTLNDKDIMERRLQTVLFRKGLARSVKQARQFIIHGHIKLKGIKISSPSYIVRKEEEASLEFVDNSTLNDKEHPERTIIQKKQKAEKSEEEIRKGNKEKSKRQIKPQHRSNKHGSDKKNEK